MRVGIFILITVLQLLSSSVSAQTTVWPTPEVEQLYKEAREFHSQGNLRQAVVRYQQAIQIAPDVLILYRDLAQAYYLAQGYDEAITTLEPIIEQGKADAEIYKVMVQSLQAIKEDKKAKKLLKQAIETLPNAGTLYHQMGLMYEQEGELVYALETWLEGIQKAPAYHLNYYEAARSYMNTDKIVWTIVYGEMFVNMEQQTPRSYDTRGMIIQAYRKLFSSLATGDIPKFGTSSTSTDVSFEEAVYKTYIGLSPIMSDGVITENLTMLRIRFIMDWTKTYASKFSFSLYGRHDDMIRTGYFDIYNQWLYGKVENPQQYDAWVKFHPKAMDKMEQWLRAHPYRPVSSDFHNQKIVGDIFSKRKN